MLREDDCIGIMPRSGATAADIPQLRPVGDRVLIKVAERWLDSSVAAEFPIAAVCGACMLIKAWQSTLQQYINACSHSKLRNMWQL